MSNQIQEDIAATKWYLEAYQLIQIINNVSNRWLPMNWRSHLLAEEYGPEAESLVNRLNVLFEYRRLEAQRMNRSQEANA